MTKLIEAQSINEAYQKVVELLREGGTSIGRQQGLIHEVGNVEITLRNPRASVLTLPVRNMSLRYAAAEFLLYFAGVNGQKAFAHYAKRWNDLAYNGEISSAYGYRMFKECKTRDNPTSRWKFALAQLLANKETKNAVVVLRDDGDMSEKLKDRCCTMFLQFYIRENRLNLFVAMRSQDVWFGLPYDIFCFTRFQQIMLYEYNKATHSNVQLGKYVHYVLNLHCYEKEWGKLKDYEPLRLRGTPYEFPEYDDRCEAQKQNMFNWEREQRLYGDKADWAEILRNGKYRPFWETLGSWIVNKTKFVLPQEEDYRFFKIAKDAATQSACIDRKVGCVIADKTRLYYTSGNNKVLNCNQMCDDKENRICETKHAEICALDGFRETYDEQPTTAWVTLFPCLPCRTALNKAGITDIRVLGFAHKGAGGSSKISIIDPEWGAI